MITCPDIGLVFIPIPKTGGKSVRAALRSMTRVVDGEPHGRLEAPSAYPAFTFVRNPWDRFGSFWFGFFTVTHVWPMNEANVRAAMAHWMMRPQTVWLPHVEHVGRYETLQEDFARFVGLDVELPVIGRSQRGPLSQVAVDMVGEVYGEEAAMFGYGVET